MAYQALYRKYRSKTFDELVGQDAIVKTLKNALIEKRIAHAYLFSGPRGTGKTSVARLFAKALNCEEGLGHQCNKCASCLAINEGSSPDVIEIDAASNSGVDEVRNLIESVRYAPINSRYKVYIIDEVHMMTNSAFNALLKTLEEPPSYVVFILCTTEPYKLLPTILSRCQRYDFKKIDDKDLKNLLMRVLNEEKVECEPGVVDLIVEMASGGARDSLSILDQLIAYANGKIVLGDAQKIFGVVSNEDKGKFIDYIAKSNILSVIKLLDDFTQRSVDISRFLYEILILFKDSLIYALTNDSASIETNDLSLVKNCSVNFSNKTLSKLIDILLKCQGEMKTSSNPYALFEIYALKMIGEAASEKQISASKVEKITPVISKTPQIKVKISTPAEEINNKELDSEREETEEKNEKEKRKDKLEQSVKSDKKYKFLDEEFIAKIGKKYVMSKEDLIKVISIAKKTYRNEVVRAWPNLINEGKDDKANTLLKWLYLAHPYVVTDNILIIDFDFKKPAELFNIVENSLLISNLSLKPLGKKYKIYALNREEMSEVTQHFMNLKQINKLPIVEKESEIILKTEE